MVTAFVTGATGFVGLNLAAALDAHGFRTVAIRRKASNAEYLSRFKVELHEADLEDLEALKRAMPEEVDVVFHVAGDVSFWRGHAERQRRVNIDGTRNVVEAALQRGARRFVYTSSVFAFGLGHASINEETRSTAPSSPIGYVRTKWEGEQEVLKGIKRGLSAIILNPGSILGPYQTTSWAKMILLMKSDKLLGIPPGSASFCHVREVVRAHLAAISAGGVGQRYLLGGTDARWGDVAAIIGELLGKEPPLAVPAIALKALGCVNDAVSVFTRREPDITRDLATFVTSNWRIDSSKAERVLGYRPIPLREMVEDCHRWLHAEGLV
jgi:nucleoside-diphosphate-sugar epimerase